MAAVESMAIYGLYKVTMDLAVCYELKSEFADAGALDIQFTTSSCFQYPQWRTDDIGVCGWAGASCAINSNNMTNCC